MCWGIQDLLWWEKWVLMMPSSLHFCCFCSCPCFLPSGYLWWLVLLSLTVTCPFCKPVCQYSWETSSLWEEFGCGELWHRISSRVLMETGKILSLALSYFLCPDSSGWLPLLPGVWTEVKVLPVFTCVSALLWNQLSPRRICVWRAVAQDQL